MSISSINPNSSRYSNSQISSSGSVNSNVQVTSTSSGGYSIASASGAGTGGGFASAVSQALAQIGVTPTATGNSTGSTASSTAQAPTQAIGAFMQSLYAALQSESGTLPTLGTKSGAGQGGNRQGSGSSTIQGKVQRLLQQLSSPSGTSTADNVANSSNSTTDELQTSFNNLLSASDVTGGNANLQNFLQSLSQDLLGASPTGNVINTVG